MDTDGPQDAGDASFRVGGPGRPTERAPWRWQPLFEAWGPGGHHQGDPPRARVYTPHASHADQRLLAVLRLLSDVLRWEGPAHLSRARGSVASVHGRSSQRPRRRPLPP